MAVARGAVRRGAAARRTALLLIFALCGLVLASLFNNLLPLGPRSGHTLVEDQRTAKQLFELAKASGDAAEFAAHLRKAGLMLGDSGSGSVVDSSKGSENSDSDSKASTAVQKPSAVSSNGSGAKRVVPQLSRDLAHKHARDGIIIVTWANYHFFDFVLNWVHHVKLHSINNYLIGAMDADTGQALAERGLNVFAMYDEKAGQADTGLGKEDFGWGSPTFHKMGRQKVDLARTFNNYGLDLCLCDVDTVWVNDPTQYFERYPQADILASSDDLSPSNPKGDDGLEQADAMHSAMNIGLLFFRHSQNTSRFIDEWQRQLDADSKAWDQNVFNRVANFGLLPFNLLPENNRLVWAFNHSLVFGVLPVAQFASGHTFFVQRLFEYQQVKPYVVHTTFQYGGTKGKRHRLREALLWVDPPEYYAEGQFLSVDLNYPSTPANYQEQDKVMMEGQRFKTTWDGNDMADLHLKNMRLQLLQLKTAFQLAVALNRTIVMPKLLAWCDRYWGPLEFCQLPGAFKLRLPFVAPMDHILEPFNFDDGIGAPPPIHYREYSFLYNPRTPKNLKDSKIIIMPSASVKKVEEKEKDGKKEVLIPQGLTEVQLREALAPYKDAQLLHFSSLENAFGHWSTQQLTDFFQHRLAHMMGFFCCKKVKEGEDGGYPYNKFMMEPKT